MEKNIMLTTMLLAGTMMLGCNPKEILEPVEEIPFEYPTFVIIDGDTVKTREDKSIKDKFNGHPDHFRIITTGDTVITYKNQKISKPNKATDLSKVASPDRKGNKFRLVTFGGSLTAGVRDGGLYNEGMQTSIGSLLANQMGVDFKNPVFDATDYNGYGRIEPTKFNPTKGPIPKFKNVTNNTAIDLIQRESNGKVVLKKVKTDFDNYSFPYSSFISKGETPSYINGDAIKSPFEKRLGNINISAELKAGKTFDFFVMEIPVDDNLDALPSNDAEFELFKKQMEIDNSSMAWAGGPPGVAFYYKNFFKKLERIKAKGVIINMINPFDCPYYEQNYKKEILDLVSKFQISELNWVNGKNDLNVYSEPITNPLNRDIIWGNGSLDSLLSPNVNLNIKPGILKNNPVTISSINFTDLVQKRKYIEENNSKLDFFAKKMQIPIVNLYEFYKSLSNGGLKNIDGVQVSSEWLKGNFFSADGITPSAFGQAVITNEVIKTINSFYKTEIPYISTREFLK